VQDSATNRFPPLKIVPCIVYSSGNPFLHFVFKKCPNAEREIYMRTESITKLKIVLARHILEEPRKQQIRTQRKLPEKDTALKTGYWVTLEPYTSKLFLILTDTKQSKTKEQYLQTLSLL